MVVIEPVVFGGDQRVHHIGRNLVQRHPLPVDAPVLGQYRAVRSQQHRRRFRLGLAQVANAGREGDQYQHVKQHQRGQHQSRPHGVPPGGAREAATLSSGESGCAVQGRGHGGSLRWRSTQVVTVPTFSVEIGA